MRVDQPEDYLRLALELRYTAAQMEIDGLPEALIDSVEEDAKAAERAARALLTFKAVAA